MKRKLKDMREREREVGGRRKREEEIVTLRLSDVAEEPIHIHTYNN